MSERILKSPHFIRIGEWMVPFVAWSIITFPIWFSFFHPAIVAYFIIAFDLYFLYKSFGTAYYASLSYKTILLFLNVSFVKKIEKKKEAEEVCHFVIVPNYKEPLYKIESSVNSFAQNDYPFKKIVLVMAFEKREDEAEEKYRVIKEKYSDKFHDIFATYHELLPNEAPGKASNQTFAAKIIDTYCREKELNSEKVLITICDADSHLPKNYFSYLTYEYLKDKDRLYHFYWAPVLLYNNFGQLPFFVRMQATLSSILRLAFLSQPDQLIQISTYSTSLWLLREVGFWDVDIIPEDWHIYFQAFFKFGAKVRTVPLFTIINGDAVYSGGLVKTLVNRYEQEKRWAWGVSDIAYFWNHLFITPHIKMSTKLRKFIFLAKHHVLWPSSFFILTLSASVPPLINPVFKRTVLGFLLPQLSGLILTIASLMLLLYVYLDIQLRKKVNIKTHIINVPFLLIQWYLLPIVSFFLSALPALDAHTRLLLGKKITYKVTEKV